MVLRHGHREAAMRKVEALRGELAQSSVGDLHPVLRRLLGHERDEARED